MWFRIVHNQVEARWQAKRQTLNMELLAYKLATVGPMCSHYCLIINEGTKWACSNKIQIPHTGQEVDVRVGQWVNLVYFREKIYFNQWFQEQEIYAFLLQSTVLQEILFCQMHRTQFLTDPVYYWTFHHFLSHNLLFKSETYLLQNICYSANNIWFYCIKIIKIWIFFKNSFYK